MLHKALTVLIILVVVGIVIGVGLLTNNSNNPNDTNSNIIEMKYQPMQCVELPWIEYYKSGEIKYFKEPTEKELVIAYFGNKQNITILDFNKINSNNAVCEACGVCPTSYYYLVKINSYDENKMLSLGWNN